MRAAYVWWRTQLEAGAGPTYLYQTLMERADAAMSGPPERSPEEYLRRSPIQYIDATPAAIPYLIAHGAADVVVPTKQSCQLAQRLGVDGHRFDNKHQLITGTPSGCETIWRTSTASVAGWPAKRYLLVYEGLADPLQGTGAATMHADVAGFLSAKMP
jgi:hypothetical protein